MNWTRETPTQAGFYLFIKRNLEEPESERFDIRGHERLAVFEEGIKMDRPSGWVPIWKDEKYYSIWWYGPIPKFERPEEAVPE